MVWITWPYKCADGCAGGRLLRHVLEKAQQHEEVIEAYLHVHVTNEDAIRFYKKYGFIERGVVQQYYRRLNPPDAVILWKGIHAPQTLTDPKLQQSVLAEESEMTPSVC